jgi:hypothetical protein
LFVYVLLRFRFLVLMAVNKKKLVFFSLKVLDNVPVHVTTGSAPVCHRAALSSSYSSWSGGDLLAPTASAAAGQ